MPIDGRLDKQKVVHPYTGVLVSLKKEVLTPATTLTNLENIIVSEASQSQKHKRYYINPLT